MSLSSLYSEIEKALLAVLVIDGTGESSRALSLINRAQEMLNNYCDWHDLRKKATLTASSGYTYPLPTDCLKLMEIYVDTNADGSPDYFYFSSKTDINRGFSVSKVFAKSSGYVDSISFATAPIGAPIAEYIMKLDNFIGSGTEYCPFSMEIMLVTAQMIHHSETGMGATDFQMMENRFNKLIDKERSLRSKPAPPMTYRSVDSNLREIRFDVVGLVGGDHPPMDARYNDNSRDVT
jgi:hypothetical protein